ncbi:hypothetical protein BCR24_06865 [Enterococcus ureilyticus]|uniref:TipC family immunity protein n=1 Tax=Enterococcus ureilyticus TaxID=1131292 RepID=A0A1E5H9S9_9ENTE|nr:TipC family immunity protein [Enterococcus ureilyticus]MBM7688491.1 hypothetical protein [Enterococcus ureilyticus]OEG21586.1 hypothetical protein BCR24_06865 [Enterococcus ureilyticus]
MKKKLLIIVALGIMIIIGYKGLEYLKIKNVFDEIYSGEYDDLGYVLNPKGFPKMKQIERWDRKAADTNNVAGPIIESYKKEFLGNGESLSISFMFSKKKYYIEYTEKISPEVSIYFTFTYFFNDKVIKENFSFLDNTKENHTITNYSEINKYLSEYNISKRELKKKAYDILYDRVIKDWTNTYPSRFSVKDIGEVDIEKDEFLK